MDTSILPPCRQTFPICTSTSSSTTTGGRGTAASPTANRSAHGDNPSCGDQCDVFLRLDGDRIAEITFDGSGCAISQASASLMTTQLKGKTAAEAEKLYGEFHEIVTTARSPRR